MTTVAVVDDDAIFREGLESYVRLRHQDIELVVEARSMADLQTHRASLPTAPDVVVLDVVIKDGTRLAANISYLSEWGAHVVVVTGDPTPSHMLAVAMEQGACGFLHKVDGFGPVVVAIEEAAAGRLYFNAPVARLMHKELRARLTDREQEVLRLYAFSMSAEEVAARLHLSVATVKSHLKSIRARYREVNRPIREREDFRLRAHADGYLGDW